MTLYKEIAILDTTADIGIKVHSSTIHGLFEASAEGLFNLICDREKVKNRFARVVELVADDWETLLVDWLNELIWLHDSYELLFNRFQIVSLLEYSIAALIWGDSLKNYLAELNFEVKAATFHRLSVVKDSKGWQGQVIFDI